MKIGKIVKTIATIYLAVFIVPPIIDGTIKVVKFTGKIVKNKFSDSKKAKEVKKYIKLRRQGVITVDYEDINN